MCLSEPGTRRRYAICVYAPRVNHSLAEGHFFFSPSPLVARAGRLAAWHDMVTYLCSWWRCVACLLFDCMRRHTFCPLSLPFASYVSGRAGGGWARLGYASWSPFTFVGVVAVLVSCSLRSVAWHATYLDPTSHLCMFFFCLCVFFVCCASPRWRVASFARSSLLCRFFVPPCLSLHTILLVRGGDDLAAFRARTYGHTFLSLCVRGCAQAFIRCHLLLVFLAGAVFVALFVAAHFGVA